MAFSLENARIRATMMNRIRRFFKERGVLEVETPVLGHGAATDCNIDLFTAAYRPSGASNDLTETVYLQPSPELPMKRLLACGFPDIYQICKVFRNGEYGRLHNPEFTMLEWYRHGFTMRDMIEETVTLLKYLTDAEKVVTTPYQQLFRKITDIDPLVTSIEEIEHVLDRMNIESPEFTDLDDALIFTMNMVVEPSLSPDELTVVYNYPASQAVLSIIDSDDDRIARRFEIYYRDMELANGFEELTDGKEYVLRFEEENRKRCTVEKNTVTPDDLFLRDIGNGLPPCAGVAVGLDRVLLSFLRESAVDAGISFGWNNC